MRIRKVNKALVLLTSLLFPGFAHAWLGYYLKAVAISVSLIFHLILIYMIYRYQVLQYPLTIASLLLAICVHYFYSVFDALQMTEYELKSLIKSKRVKFALGLVLSWGVVVSISFFSSVLATQIVSIYPYTFLLFTITYLVTHIKSKQWKAFYMGRWTAILCLIIFIVAGIFFPILWVQIQANVLVSILILLLALEFSVFYMLKKLFKKTLITLRFDSTALIVVIIFGAIFLLVPKYGHLPSELLKSFHGVNRTQINYEVKYEKQKDIETISVTAGDHHSKLAIHHQHGSIELRSYLGEYIKVVPTRYDVSNVDFQSLIENTNRVDVTMDDENIKIESILAQYENSMSKMDIVIYIPYSVDMNELYLSVQHGSIKINSIKQFDIISVNSNETNVNVIESSGDLNVQIKEGTTYVSDHYGRVAVKSRKGNIMLHKILKEIDAETLNGTILIRMKALYESIYAHASIGSVHINLPDLILYNLYAESSFGTIIVNDLKYVENVTLSTPFTTKQINIYADQNVVID